MRILTPAAAIILGSLAALSADTFPAGSGESIQITPFMHASVQLAFNGTVVQIDPWGAGDLSKAKRADLILITDDPPHHLDAAAIAKLRKPGAPVVMPASGKASIPDGIVLANGKSGTFAGVRVESVAAYDLKPGAPEHPKGEANGYVVTLGGRRIYFAGVTECVPEVKALQGINVAFMPMNIPVERMTPADAAECVKTLKPKVVYPYHYDQDYVTRLGNPQGAVRGLPGGMTIPQSLQAFREALRGQPIDVRSADWYPVSRGN